ncbi:MAG: BACON domain-containing protein [Phaeodactylibacter sp.]|nr:BACON domain-containing protein [Phaeodactylibacter sp.]
MKLFHNVFFKKGLASELAIRSLAFTQALLPTVALCILSLGCTKSSDVDLPTVTDLNNNDRVINASLVGQYSLPCSSEQWTLYIGEFIPGTVGTASGVTIPCSNQNYSCSGAEGENVVFIGFADENSGLTQYSGPAYDAGMQCMAGSLSNVSAHALHHELVHFFFIMNDKFDHDERQIHCIAASIPTICPGAISDVQTILTCLYGSELFQREVQVVGGDNPGTTGPIRWFGGFFLVYVDPGCGNFQAVSDDDWMTIDHITPGDRDSKAIVVVDVQYNYGPLRTGTLRVAGNIINVRQDGPP